MFILKCVLAFIGTGTVGFVLGITFPERDLARIVAALMALGAGCFGLLCFLSFN